MFGSIVVKAGHHDRGESLVSVTLPENTSLPADIHLRGRDGRRLACQLVDNGHALLFKLDCMLNGSEETFEIHPGTVPCQAVTVCDGTEEGSLDIRIDGNLFTALHTSREWAKPFMYPVYNSRNVQVTRAYPVIPDVPGETHDHPHQKSLWTAWGDVNGVDIWGEAKTYGREIVTSIEILENGPLRVTLRLGVDWVNQDGKRLMSEIRDLRFMAFGAERAVDMVVTFQAEEDDVTLGDTKEGGLCSVRVASSMDGTAAGLITLADGSIGEQECWGKRACWCDYVGPVPGGMAGICIMDNPSNYCFPTYWHVRNYGLMTANPFGVSYFTNDKKNNGSLVIPAGTSKTWNYRVLFHLHQTAADKLDCRYHEYVHAPACTFIPADH